MGRLGVVKYGIFVLPADVATWHYTVDNIPSIPWGPEGWDIPHAWR